MEVSVVLNERILIYQDGLTDSIESLFNKKIDPFLLKNKVTPMNFLPETNGISITQLISGCIRGKNESWDLFFQTFHRLVTGMVQQNSYASKEDTIQMIYLRLIEEDSRLLRKFNGQSYAEFLLFLKEICRNVIRDENRKFKKKSLVAGGMEYQEETIIDPKSLPFEDPEEDRDRLLEKMMDLELGFREVMVLKINGYKAREIAEILNIPLNTVLTRIKRSIEKIKKNKSTGIKYPSNGHL